MHLPKALSPAKTLIRAMHNKKQEGDHTPRKLDLNLPPPADSPSPELDLNLPPSSPSPELDLNLPPPELDLNCSIEPPPPPPPPPFPWATDDPAIPHPHAVLLARGILSIHGDVDCLICERRISIAYDLQEKYDEVCDIVLEEGPGMNQRALHKWMHPEYPDCPVCGKRGSMRPAVDADSEERINWLFLFLGQMLGACEKKQLEWLCKQAKSCFTGDDKDQLLYYSYVAICRQLEPGGRFRHLL